MFYVSDGWLSFNKLQNSRTHEDELIKKITIRIWNLNSRMRIPSLDTWGKNGQIFGFGLLSLVIICLMNLSNSKFKNVLFFRVMETPKSRGDLTPTLTSLWHTNHWTSVKQRELRRKASSRTLWKLPEREPSREPSWMQNKMLKWSVKKHH